MQWFVYVVAVAFALACIHAQTTKKGLSLFMVYKCWLMKRNGMNTLGAVKANVSTQAFSMLYT